MRLSDRATIVLLALLSWTLLFGGIARAASPEQEAVLGIWSGGDSLMSVAVRSEGLSMTILAIRDAVYFPDEGIGEPGSPRRDDNNPDPALQDRLLVGLELLADYRWTGKRWEGKIYDPASGNTYSSRMELDGNRLKMRGYIGMPMLGRTRHFDRVESCEARVAEMAAASKVELALCD
jgi:hypothetical protein